MELPLSKGLGTIVSGHQLMAKGPWPWKEWCMTAMHAVVRSGSRWLKVAKSYSHFFLFERYGGQRTG